jgi:protein SCO1/2
MIRTGLAPALLLSCVVAAGCARPAPPNREFPLTGEILAIRADRAEITVKHDEVKGFMPAMTMPFAVKDPALLDGLAAGDLISARLVLTDEESFLTAIRKTGVVPPDARGRIQPAPEALAPGHAVPDIALTLDDGRTATLASLRGKAVLLTFVYTRCPLPDYCPRMDRSFKAIQTAVLADRAAAGRVQLLSLSFDPAYDTPARLAAHARQVGAVPSVWRYATAPQPEIDAFGALFGLSVVREGPEGANITHNLRTVLIGQDGTHVKSYNGGQWEPPEVVRDLLALAARR